MNLTLVAYKPDSSCISMGCVTDNYSSDFHISHHQYMRSLIAKQLELEDYKYGDQESEYEFHVLNDGVPKDQWPQKFTENYTELKTVMTAERAEMKEAARIEAERVAAEEAQAKAEKDAEAQVTSDKKTLLTLAEKLNCTVIPKDET